jgi:hypothetical protein
MWFSSRARRRPGAKAPRARLTVEALEGRAVPAFLAPVTSPGPITYALVGDFNNDHVPDLVGASADATGVEVLLGNGDGTFQPPLTAAPSGSPSPRAVGDLNHDGNLDVVTSNSVLLGNGDGTFQAPQALPLPLVGTLSTGGAAVAVGDLNGDGNLDVVGTHRVRSGFTQFSAFGHTGLLPTYTTDVDVCLGNGDGSFQQPISTPLGDSPVSPLALLGHPVVSPGVVLADFTGDGKLDVLSGGLGDLILLPGTGTGAFAAPATINGFDTNVVGSPRTGINAGDFNGDGRLDFLIGNSTTGAVSIFLNTGSGAFAAPKAFAVGAAYSARDVADLNHDGKLDVVAVNSTTGTVSVLLGNGNGTLQRAQQFAGVPGANLAAVADLTGDSLPDLALRSSSAVSVLRNDGNWPPVLFISDVSRLEGKNGRTAFTFTVTLSAPSDVPVTVNYATADGTATVADNDYLPSSGTLTFAPGETSKTITVWVNGDRKKEPDESFFVNLSRAVNAGLADTQGLGTIVNDD